MLVRNCHNINPAMLNGFEIWTIEARDARRIKAAEMKNSAGYISTDNKTNTEIEKEPNINSFLRKIQK